MLCLTTVESPNPLPLVFSLPSSFFAYDGVNDFLGPIALLISSPMVWALFVDPDYISNVVGLESLSRVKLPLTFSGMGVHCNTPQVPTTIVGGHRFAQVAGFGVVHSLRKKNLSFSLFQIIANGELRSRCGGK